jgi:leucyl/phenylalanyl-tRNA--protein transferase
MPIVKTRPNLSALRYIHSVRSQTPDLPWLEPGQNFPPTTQTWKANSAAPGLLAAGGALNIETLCRAYRQGIFPWFGKDEPILWWSPDPRMVLQISKFKLHPSLKKTIKKFITTPCCEVRIDTVFEQVISACATSPRQGQRGSWIVPKMISAYCELHKAGFAHSVETWIDGKLAGGLYCVAIGKSVFGESMFSRSTDSSKIALSALVSFCKKNAIAQIDCQQNTAHMTTFGAGVIARDKFNEQIASGLEQAAPAWIFGETDWQYLLGRQEDRHDGSE